MTLIPLVWFIVVTIVILIFYKRYNKKAILNTKETMNLPRGFFRVILLITLTALYILVIVAGTESCYLTSIESLLKYVIIFYFSTGIVKELKTKI